MAHGHRPWLTTGPGPVPSWLPEKETMSHDQSQANLELALDRAERKAVRLTLRSVRLRNPARRGAGDKRISQDRDQWRSSLSPSHRSTLSRRLPTCQTQVAHDGSKAIRDTIEAYVRGYTQFLACPWLCGGGRAFSGARGAQIR